MATLIKNLKDYKLTTGAIVDFHTRVNELIAATTPAALHVEDLTETYTAQLDTLNSVVNRATAYQNTQLMEQKDKERDNLFSVIRNVVKAHATNTLPAKNEAAVRLGAVMAPYEDLRKHQYNKETTELRGLIKQLKANAGLTATLGIDEEIAELETVNEAFDNAFKAKTEEQAARQEQKGIDTKEAVLCPDTARRNDRKIHQRPERNHRPVQQHTTRQQNGNGNRTGRRRIVGTLRAASPITKKGRAPRNRKDKHA